LAIAAGILAGSFFAFFTDITYEFRLILTSFFSFLGVLVGVCWGKPTDVATLNNFISKVDPIGFWPDRSFKQSLKEVFIGLMKWFFICSGMILLITSLHKLIFMGDIFFSLILLFAGGLPMYLAISGITKHKNRRFPCI
jgi:hypothetical protein